MRKCLHFLVYSLCVLGLGTYPTNAQADIYHEFYGSRSLAMGGAHRGIGTSNDTLLLNPAGMAVTQRYSVDMQYAYGTGDNLNDLSGSAVDSKSGPVAGGVAYTRNWGNPSRLDATLNRVALGFAYSLGHALALGATVKTIRGAYTTDAGRQEIDLYTGTLGATATLGEMLSLGVSWENIVKGDAEAQRLAKPVLGLGLGLHLPMVAIGTDMVIDTRSQVDKRLTYHAGGEVVVYELLVVRGGFHTELAGPRQGASQRYYVSGGLGLVSQAAALSLSAQRALINEGPWEIVAGFALMM